MPKGRVGKIGSRLVYGEHVEEHAEADGEAAAAEAAAAGGGGGKAAGKKRARPSGPRAAPVLVEQLCREHFALASHGGWDSAHDEGGALRQLFALLLHDCILSAVPDAFFSPAQSAPLDLCHPNFYDCLLYTSPSPRDVEESRMPSSA